jgi:tagaturonate reductase
MILQFGTSRFLQAHVALFAHQARIAGQPVPDIVVAKTTRGGDRDARLQGFSDPNGYEVILRGLRDGQPVNDTIQVKSIVRGFGVAGDWNALVQIATGPLQYIVSNTGDAGYVVAPEDRTTDWPQGQAPLSFPAILLALLHYRWQSGGAGVTLLPCELVQRNADLLRGIVTGLARERGCNEAFVDWLESECVWANTLVDRIVSGALEPTGAIAEPYGLWAIEDQPGLVLPFTHPDIVTTDNLEPFERLKLHVLNLGHTWLAERWAAHGLPAQLTVREALADAKTLADLSRLYAEEVVPGFAQRGMEDEARTYVATTLERFCNPYLDHRIADIHSGHPAKVAKRIAAFIQWVEGAPAGAPALTQLREIAALY